MPTYRFNYIGTLSGIETFQHGFSATASGTLADALTEAEDWLDAFTSFSGVAALFTTGTVWNQINVQQLGGFGDPIVDSALASIEIPGTNSSDPLPPQIAVCVSMLTGLAGARNRGRFYLPPPADTVLTTAGRLSSSSMTILANGLESAFTALNTAGFSPVIRSSVGGGAETAVTQLRVGSVLDTQRRRRNQIAETYEVRAIP
jgi:hypothetical protein